MLILAVAAPVGLAWEQSQPASPAAQPGEDDWREVLERARGAAERVSYSAETLNITWEDTAPSVSIMQVSNLRGGALVLADTGEFTLRLGEAGGELVSHERGWLVPLPPPAPEPSNRLASKYRVELGGTARVLTRRATVIEVYRRGDDTLRERLLIDDATGLLLRRETYDGAGELLRLSTFLSLEFGVAGPEHGDRAAEAATDELYKRPQDALEVDDDGLATLAAADWTVPETLPGGYEVTGGYALSGERSQPLHLVYSDGLYAVSLFQQRGDADWDSLPEGAEAAPDLDWHAYHWPGAVPRRLAWEADGSMFVLVGDAPPEEFTAIASALPHPPEPGFFDRLREGLRTILSRVAIWK